MFQSPNTAICPFPSCGARCCIGAWSTFFLSLHKLKLTQRGGNMTFPSFHFALLNVTLKQTAVTPLQYWWIVALGLSLGYPLFSKTKATVLFSQKNVFFFPSRVPSLTRTIS